MPQLVILDSKPLALDAKSKDLPARLKLMDWGANKGAKGTFTLGAKTLADFAANQATCNFDRVALDFNHNTVPGTDAYRGEPAEVAAHGTPELVNNDGLYLRDIEWTAEGKHFVGGRHYIDLSPSILTDEKGEVLFLHSAAACRQGALEGRMIPLSATQLPALEKLTASEDKMLKNLLLKLLNLSATATDAEIETAAEAHAKKLETLSAPPAAATVTEPAKKAPTGELAEVLSVVKTLGASVETLTKTVTTLQAAGQKGAIDTILAGAAREGKVVPKEFTEGATALSAAQLTVLVAGLPATIPLDQRTPAHVAGGATGVLVTNSAEEEVRKNLGVSEETWKKHNKAA